MAAALVLLLWPEAAGAAAVKVSVNGVAVNIPKGSATIADALAGAGLQLHTGVMRAVVSGDVLPVGAIRPRVWRDGRRAHASNQIETGDRLRLVNGVDYVEPTDESMHPLASGGFPDVETTVWQPGAPGQVRRIVGRVSGQTADAVIAPAQPALPVPGSVVLFSFDDGPDARWTPQVLDILKSRGARAVFCVVGVQIDQFPALVKRIHDEGHVLCDHTAHHDTAMPTRPLDYVAAEIRHTYNQIRDITGQPPRFYRAPGGSLSPFIIEEAHRLGMRVLGWSVDSADYRKPGAATIQNRILFNLRAGGVALMHDGGGDRSQTVMQLAGLIDRVRAAGYAIVAP